MIHSAPDSVLNANAGPMGQTTSELPPVALAFLERLRRLPLGAWADAGRRLAELDADERRTLGRTGHGTDATARAVLRQVVNASPRMAGQARHRVVHLAAVAHGFVHPNDVARMKKAALAAVLALVARPELGEDRFSAVYEPFAAIIPVADLPDAGIDVAELEHSTVAR